MNSGGVFKVHLTYLFSLQVDPDARVIDYVSFQDWELEEEDRLLVVLGCLGSLVIIQILCIGES